MPARPSKKVKSEAIIVSTPIYDINENFNAKTEHTPNDNQGKKPVKILSTWIIFRI
jgi:hypothetical protein